MEPCGRTKESLRPHKDHIRIWIAFAASLALHLIAIAFVTAFISSGGASDKRLSGLSDAPFIVSIVNPEKRDRPAIFSSKQIVPKQTARAPDAYPGAQASVQNGTVSPRRMSLPGFYYSASELDAIPTIQRDIDLYPPELRDFKHGGGKAVLRLWIDEAGHVAKVEPVSSDLTAIFIEVATRVFLQAHFLPGRKNGLAVKSKVDAVLLYSSSDSNR